MSCCAHCKQPLPRCYVCLLYMGLVNPQTELKMAMRRKAGDSVQQQGENKAKSTTEMTEEPRDSTRYDYHNVLSSGHWFMWCQNCKHGGHANCIDMWFTDDDCVRKLCGVNGCNCRCIIVK